MYTYWMQVVWDGKTALQLFLAGISMTSLPNDIESMCLWIWLVSCTDIMIKCFGQSAITTTLFKNAIIYSLSSMADALLSNGNFFVDQQSYACKG